MSVPDSTMPSSVPEEEKKQKRPTKKQTEIVAYLGSLILRWNPAKRSTLEKGVLWMKKKGLEAHYKELIEAIEGSLSIPEPTNTCFCGDEDPHTNCKGCGVGLCLSCEAEVGELGTQHCLSCAFRRK